MPASGEILETSATETSVIDADRLEAASEPGHFSVATLLAVAAVIAALVSARAFMLSSTADDAWQSSLRTEVKRSAAVMNDTGALYRTELPVAVQILQARVLAAAFRAAAGNTTGAARDALLLQAAAEANVASALASSSTLASDGSYALPSGGFDLSKRLTDIRNGTPDLVALDPDALQAQGDELASKASLMTLTLLPTSLGAFLGVLAQPLRQRRTLLLAAGSAAVGVGAVLAVGVEVLV
jgi:hypothetical protein